MAKQTQGRRVYDTDRFAPGDYGKDPRNGEWLARPPDPRIHLGSLAGHDVTEHEDGTITASPSILIRQPHGESGEISWHGYLRRGAWEEC